MKILLLNSGGFDSVVLAHKIKEDYPDAEVISFFIDYGQQSCDAEYNCSVACSEKLGFKHMILKIPPFCWTGSEFYKEGFKDNEHQEVEYRNFVFLSYAASLAASGNCTHIFMATLKSVGYVDTSKEFLDSIDHILNLKGIKLVTPFSENNKYDLLPIAFRNNIKKGDFISCDAPVNGEPCGKCPDCLVTNHIMSLCDTKNPVVNWIKSDFNPYSDDFVNSLMSEQVTEARLLINNSCQLNCKHCFYGFKEMKSSPLTEEEYKKVIDDCIKLGIKNFHFSGKEPLIDDKIFTYTQYIKENYPEVTYEVVTNGLTIPTMADKIKKAGFSKIFISVDDVLKTQEFRTSNTSKALETIKDYNLPCQVFIDLHKSNYLWVDDIILSLFNNYDIREFYVRTIHNIGNGSNIERLSLEKVDTAFHVLKNSKKINGLPIQVSFCITAPYTYDFMYADNGYSITSYVCNSIEYLGLSENNVVLIPELFCEKYGSQITITPDGYVLGCGTEVSLSDYPKYSAGNVRNERLSEIVLKGKKSCVKCNQMQVDNDGNLKFHNCIRKTLDELV